MKTIPSGPAHTHTKSSLSRCSLWQWEKHRYTLCKEWRDAEGGRGSEGGRERGEREGREKERERERKREREKGGPREGERGREG